MRILVASIALLMLAGCDRAPTAPAEVDAEAEKAAIKEIEAAQIKAIQAKDAAASAANYSEDAVFVGEDGKPIEGTKAIGESFAAMVKDPALEFDYQQGKMVVSKAGDMAYSTATYSYTYTDAKSGKPVTTSGSNLSVWQKQADGSWKLVADNNAGQPAG